MTLQPLVTDKTGQ